MVRKLQRAPVSKDAGNQLEPLAVSVPEGCRIVGVKRSTIYREIAAGRIRALKAGKRTLLPMDSLRAWLASLPNSTSL